MTQDAPQPGNGMVLIGGFWIAEEHVRQYVVERERAAVAAEHALQRFCARVVRCWQDSQDGEAVVGYGADGQIRGLIHLDPDGVAFINRVDADTLLAHLSQP